MLLKINKRLPFRISERLMTTSNRKPVRKSKHELNAIKKLIKDKNFRIFLTEKGINVLNSEIKVEGIDPFDFYSKLNMENDASHSFYLGVELARAQIEFQLGKNYDQDNELEWGVAYKQIKILIHIPNPNQHKKKMIIETIISTINTKGDVNTIWNKKTKNFVLFHLIYPQEQLEKKWYCCN